jgi:hypothetical protein
MNILTIFLLVIVIVSFMLYLLSTILIYRFLKRRNDKLPGYFIMWLGFRTYLKKYKRITRGIHRRTGGLYYLYLFSLLMFFITLLFFLLQISLIS